MYSRFMILTTTATTKGLILKPEAFEAHQASAGPCQKENWDAAMRMSSKQFAFWSLVMDLEMLQCRFVRSLREGDFDLYVQVIDELCGWLFIFDQTHYSRWLPIHVKDMVELEKKHPHVLEAFFKYENKKEPPSLYVQGKLRSGTKSVVLQCLTIPKLTPPDDVTVKVLDGPAVVHMVRPTYGTNYQQYVVRQFMPFITNSVTNSTSRPDIIGDIYPDHNLKAQAQAKRGNPGVTTIVEGSTLVPRDWNKFLALSRNKVQLFRFLSKAVIEASSQFTAVVVCSTYDDHVLVNTSDS